MRRRLGEAVRIQREADGYKYRRPFAEFAGISKRSLDDIEQGNPGVGEINLRAVGRALSTWNEDTPRVILEDGPIPPTKQPGPTEPEPIGPVMSEAEADLAARRIEVAHMSDEQIFALADRIHAVLGVEAKRQWLEGAFEIQRKARMRSSE
ncbi:helix-turn-helix domain-containing protein [Amycolatopsis taiwanensis]|uniref:helix-turn-helix domain-containing protein n=1 Tax=Amycolatopsis taiwanensis TaxID=342230 RepID=UPI000487E9D6|nr:hypothetical protein [Amycolatopsis taiwanensis]